MSSTFLYLETKEEYITEKLLPKIKIYLLYIESVPVTKMFYRSLSRKLEKVVLIFYTKKVKGKF